MTANSSLARMRCGHWEKVESLPHAAVLLAFFVAAVAYTVAANVDGYSPANVGALPAMWACVVVMSATISARRFEVGTKRHFASSSTSSSSAVGKLAYVAAQSRYIHKAHLAVQLCAPALLFIGAVGLARAGDRHGAAWGFLGAIATSAVAWLALFSHPAAAVAAPGLEAAGPAFSTGAAPADTAAVEAATQAPEPFVVAVPWPAERRVLVQTGGDVCSGAAGGSGGGRGKCARCCSPASCRSGCLSCMHWAALVLLGIFALGWAIQGCLLAQDKVAYPPPGTLHPIAISGTSPAVTHSMHIHCAGPVDYTRPTFIFEAGGGASGLSFQLAQDTLTAAGRRSCWYDRSGYGWSEPLPVGTASVEDTARKLADLLAAEGIPSSAPVILVGHSAGVEIAQVFAHTYPSRVVGYAGLDGYPDYRRLMGMAAGAITADDARVCAALQAARAFDAVALTRIIQAASGPFNPPELTGAARYTYNTGHAWYSQWVDVCREKGPTPTQWLEDAAGPSVQPPDPANGLKWPALTAGTPVLLIPAGKTVEDGTNPANMYYKQMQAYRDTLSPGHATLVIATGKGHDFPWAEGQWLGQQLLATFP